MSERVFHIVIPSRDALTACRVLKHAAAVLHLRHVAGNEVLRFLQRQGEDVFHIVDQLKILHVAQRHSVKLHLAAEVVTERGDYEPAVLHV
ncbi:MAG: hypothetical protein LBQ19_01070, partial [Synergistaceae bacterium]|nr:hypothetical protein [Synergistaceae bacterium]